MALKLSSTPCCDLGSVNAASVQVRGYLLRTTTPGHAEYAIDLDNFVLVLNSTTPVELLRFDIQ